MNVKSLQVAQQKYTTRAGAAQTDYTNAVAATPPGVWEAATIAAATNFSQGVQAAVAAGRFQSGVTGKGPKWARKVAAVGGSRYAQGVSAAGPDYAAGFQRFHDALQAATLSPKGPRGDARNYDRAKMVGDLLHKIRVAGTA